MRPDERDLDDEIRGHLALSIKERIERGEEPEAARLAALREFGYVPAARDGMRRVWHSRWFDALTALLLDMRVGLRSLWRAKGLALTVVVTLALGIGANAAIFSVVRGVLLRPLVNRDEARLVYIRQSASGVGTENMTFSMAEYQRSQGPRHHHRRFRRFLDHRVHHARQRRAAPAARRRGRRVVLRGDGSAAGARPAAQHLGRRRECGRRRGPDASLLDQLLQQRPRRRWPGDDPRRANGDDRRRPRAVDALPRRHRDHRQHGDQPAPHGRDDEHRAHAPDDRALRPAGAASIGRGRARRADRGLRGDGPRAPRGLLLESRHAADPDAAARSDHGAGADHPARAPGRRRRRLRHRLLERRQPDPGPLGAARGRAGRSRGPGCEPRRPAPHAARREPRAVRGRRHSRRAHRRAAGLGGGALCRALLGTSARRRRRRHGGVGRREPGDRCGGTARLRAAPAVVGCGRRPGHCQRQPADHPGHQPPPAGVRDDADRLLVRAARRRGHARGRAHRPANGEQRLPDPPGAGLRRATHLARSPAGSPPGAHVGVAREHAGRCPGSSGTGSLS